VDRVFPSPFPPFFIVWQVSTSHKLFKPTFYIGIVVEEKVVKKTSFGSAFLKGDI